MRAQKESEDKKFEIFSQFFSKFDIGSIKLLGGCSIEGMIEYDRYEVFDARELGSNTLSLYDSLGLYKF